jgi:hypothetical protein
VKTDRENKNMPLTISMKHFENAQKKIRRNVTISNTNMT